MSPISHRPSFNFQSILNQLPVVFNFLVFNALNQSSDKKKFLATPLGKKVLLPTLLASYFVLQNYFKISPSQLEKYQKALLKELFVLLISSITYPLDATLFDPRVKAIPNQTPILLVHGYLHNSSAWHYFRYKLNQQGFYPVYTMNLGSFFGSIEEYAEEVKTRLQQIAKETGRQDVHIIAHSMGGLAAIECALSIDQAHIKKIITLGTPLKGTLTTFLGYGKSIKQMCLLSPYIKSLIARIKKRADLKFCHIGSKKDMIIVPYNSTILSLKNSHCHLIDSCGHFSYLYSSEVLQIVLNELKI